METRHIYISNGLKKRNRVQFCQFIQSIQQINSYLDMLPFTYYFKCIMKQPQWNLSMTWTKAVTFSEWSLATGKTNRSSVVQCAIIPLFLNAIEVAGSMLIPCVRYWMEADYLAPLDLEGWFWRGHLTWCHTWILPSAVTLIVLKQVAWVKHKWPYRFTNVDIILHLLYWEEW